MRIFENLKFLIIPNIIGLTHSFKLNVNLQSIMTSHFINQSLRKQVCVMIVNDSDIMKHLVQNHLDIFYVILLSGSIIYALSDKGLHKQYREENNSNKIPNLRRFDMLLLILISVLCKNVENAI